MPETDRPTLDTSNRFQVARTAAEASRHVGDLLFAPPDGEPRIVIFRPPLTGERIGLDDALVLAAWILALADPELGRVREIVRQIKG